MFLHNNFKHSVYALENNDKIPLKFSGISSYDKGIHNTFTYRTLRTEHLIRLKIFSVSNFRGCLGWFCIRKMLLTIY